jgi:uncharacterized protein YndB with AHSA1/START domain
MPLPERIERTVDLALPPEKVWPGLTTAEGLSGWFGTCTGIELRPGGRAHLTFSEDDHTVLHIQTVEEPRRLVFTWPVHGTGPDGPWRTRVEITLQPTPTGTRLRLEETGFADLPESLDYAHPANTAGWDEVLAALVERLDAAA